MILNHVILGMSIVILLLDQHLSLSFTIEGQVQQPPDAEADWVVSTRILVDGGQYSSFVQPDNTFEILGVPSGSYVIEVVHPAYLFEPVRVDITGKGKLRARKLSFVQPNLVKTIPYPPLRINFLGRGNYFQQREQLRTWDLLLNPTVLFMVGPLLIIMIMLKFVNTSDPEIQKEMQQQMKFFDAKQSLPEFSEMLSTWLGGGSKSSSTKTKAIKRK